MPSLCIFIFIVLLSGPPLLYSQPVKHKNYFIRITLGRTGQVVQGIGLSYYDTVGFTKTLAKLENGFYEFSGAVDEPKEAQLFLILAGDSLHSNKYLRDFILEPGRNYNIEAVDSAFSGSKITGSPITTAFDSYNAQLAAKNRAIRGLIIALGEAKKSQSRSGIDSVQSQIRKAEDDFRAFYANYAAAHLNDWMGLYAVGDLLRPPAPMAQKADSLLRRLAPPLQRTSKASLVRKKIQTFIGTSIGKIAADFTQPDVKGKSVSLSSLRGRYILLDVWASWCVPCRKENPALVNLYRQYGGKHFEIVGISYDDRNTKNEWLKAIRDDHLTWLHLSELKSPNTLVELYGVTSIPQNLLIDPQGRIIAKNKTAEEIAALLSGIGIPKNNGSPE